MMIKSQYCARTLVPSPLNLVLLHRMYSLQKMSKHSARCRGHVGMWACGQILVLKIEIMRKPLGYC